MSNAITKSEALEQVEEAARNLVKSGKAGGLMVKEIARLKDALENLEMAMESNDKPRTKWNRG